MTEKKEKRNFCFGNSINLKYKFKGFGDSNSYGITEGGGEAPSAVWERKMEFAKRLEQADESATFRYASLAKGEGIIDLTIGRTNFDTPKKIKEATKKALDEGKVYYTPSKGIPELREKIARKLEEENGIENLSPADNVIISAGGKQLIFETILALIDEGDKVAIPDPSWVSYEPIVRIAEGDVVHLPLNAEDGFIPGEEFFSTLENENPKLIILNSPNNPTGTVFPEKILRKIVEIAEKKNSWILSDEIYERILYEGKHFSPGSIYEKVVTINGFSKEFSMTGFRLGYCACGIKELIDKMDVIQQQSVSCATSFVQYGALAAFTEKEDVKKEVGIMLEELKKRRDYLIERFEKIPRVKMNKPEGAFYLFPHFEGKDDDTEFTETLLKKGVGVIPGSPFGLKGRSCIRISYGATTLSELKKAMDIIEQSV